LSQWNAGRWRWRQRDWPPRPSSASPGPDLSYWNDAANGWVVPAGTFTVYVGDSSALTSLPLRAHLTITTTLAARAGG
jgi:hypothetical protein